MIESILLKRKKKKERDERDNPRVIGYSSYPFIAIGRKIRVTDVARKISGQLTLKAFRIGECIRYKAELENYLR